MNLTKINVTFERTQNKKFRVTISDTRSRAARPFLYVETFDAIQEATNWARDMVRERFDAEDAW